MSKSIEQAVTELAIAIAAYRSELERDLERSEGSDRQERLRENLQESLREEVARCEIALEEARRLNKVNLNTKLKKNSVSLILSGISAISAAISAFFALQAFDVSKDSSFTQAVQARIASCLALSQGYFANYSEESSNGAASTAERYKKSVNLSRELALTLVKTQSTDNLKLQITRINSENEYIIDDLGGHENIVKNLIC